MSFIYTDNKKASPKRFFIEKSERFCRNCSGMHCKQCAYALVMVKNIIEKIGDEPYYAICAPVGWQDIYVSPMPEN